MDYQKPLKAQIIAFLNDEISFDDKQALYEWINKSDNNARYFAQVKDIWEASLSDISLIAETEKEWEKLYPNLELNDPLDNKKIKTTKTKSVISIFYKIAASLLIGVFIGAAFFYLINHTREPVYQSLIVPYGSMSEIILSDSSVIFLNSGTQIRYSMDYGNREREVFLTGEALFDIKHIGNKNPFIVHTTVYDIKVLGTEFNVRAYDDDNTSETTLQKGKVWISSLKAGTSADVTLKPGQQYIYDKKSNQSQVKEVDAVVFTSWKDTFSSFSKLTLHDLFVLMEQRFHVTIEVQHPNILNYHYSGTISQEDDIKSILEILQKTLPIQYEINNNKIIIR